MPACNKEVQNGEVTLIHFEKEGMIEMRAYHTPSHTKNHFVYLLLFRTQKNPEVFDKADMALFTGDCIHHGGVG